MVHFALCISLLVFTYISLDSFFLQLYLTSDLRSFQKVFVTLLYLLKTIHYANLSPTVMGCLKKKWKGGKLTCTLKVKSRMQWSCFHKMLYNFQSLIIMTSFKVCKKVPPARSELGCWQFLSVMVEDSALWPSGEAWIWRSACPCKFLLCLHVSLFHLSPHKHFFLHSIRVFFVSLAFPHLYCIEIFHAIINSLLFFPGQYEAADHTLQDKPGSRCSGWSSPLVFSFFFSFKITPQAKGNILLW